MNRNSGALPPDCHRASSRQLPCRFLLIFLASVSAACGLERTGVNLPWKNAAAAWCFNNRLQASPTLCDNGRACSRSTGFRGAGIDPEDLVPSGNIEVLRADTVIDGMDITGSIEVKAPRVTIRNSRIRSSDRYPVRVFPAGSLAIEYTEIIGTPSCEAAVAHGNYTARRLDIHGCADGLRARSNVIIEGCYIHDLAAGADSRSNGIRQLSGKNLLISNNTIEMPPGSASAITIATDSGPIDNVLIDGNIMNGGEFIVFSRTGRYLPPAVPTNVRINNNRMGRSFAHGLFSAGRSTTFSGNVWLDSGRAVPLPN